MVPIRCVISIGVEEETTLTDPLLPVRDIEVTFMEKASIQSAGESPMFTWTAVFAAGVGDGFDVVVELLPPPHAVSVDARDRVRQAIAVVVADLCRALLRQQEDFSQFIVILLRKKNGTQLRNTFCRTHQQDPAMPACVFYRTTLIRRWM